MALGDISAAAQCCEAADESSVYTPHEKEEYNRYIELLSHSTDLPTYLTTYHPTYVPMYVCPVYQVYLCVRQIHYTVYTVHTENVCFSLFTVVVVGLS